MLLLNIIGPTQQCQLTPRDSTILPPVNYFNISKNATEQCFFHKQNDIIFFTMTVRFFGYKLMFLVVKQ